MIGESSMSKCLDFLLLIYSWIIQFWRFLIVWLWQVVITFFHRISNEDDIKKIRIQLDWIECVYEHFPRCRFFVERRADAQFFLSYFIDCSQTCYISIGWFSVRSDFSVFNNFEINIISANIKWTLTHIHTGDDFIYWQIMLLPNRWVDYVYINRNWLCPILSQQEIYSVILFEDQKQNASTTHRSPFLVPLSSWHVRIERHRTDEDIYHIRQNSQL